ncbi:MAG: hypothetical protein H0X37_20545, partial [Herpetosiphonaceae bacterium]|nr:hypothetical protein [Herpetosiphonaceae bacterium]
MPLPQTAERAYRRYAAALYHSALLRDPNPQRAGEAVIAAFRAIRWDDTTLDDQIEARLVASLPPRPRIRSGRVRPFAGLPPAFWELPPPTRLALGLRLMRGMATAHIAQALHLTLAETQNLVVDGLRALHGDVDALPEACRRCRAARLDDPAAERTHLLTCQACQATLPSWERLEQSLAEQLSRVVGSLPLPPVVDTALLAALASSGEVERQRPWQRPVVVQVGLIGIILLGLLTLVWPSRSATAPGRVTTAPTPAAIIDTARKAYTSVPTVAGILHRRWAIMLGQPQLNFQAEEWVDPQQPAHHRMQLMAGQTPMEWEMGDGQEYLTYMSGVAFSFCGGPPNGVQSHTGERNRWSMAAAEQSVMRTARWQHGAWATGLHYLDLAATADTIRSLGLSGSGSDTTLTITAAGHTISGTLLLRFDPLSHALREVRELRSNNGQTEERVPWRLLGSETIPESTALEHGLLITYPADTSPPLVDRSLPVVDRGCPLVGTDQAQSLPRLLTTPATGPLIGLPQLPPGLDHALIIGPGNPTIDDVVSSGAQLDFTNLESVYVGPAKRLVLLGEVIPPDSDQFVIAGPWRVHFLPQVLPTVMSAVLEPETVPNAATATNGTSANFTHIIAEGWTQSELLPVLATLRPLHIKDWMAAQEHFYEPLPLPPVLAAHAQALFGAVQIHPGQIHHQVIRETTRQAPFFATLPDPYHAPPQSWPSLRRAETWIEYGPDEAEHRALHIVNDMTGHVLTASWYDDQSWHSYDALTGSMISEQRQPGMLEPKLEAAVFAGTLNWHWTTRPDGSLQAEHAEDLASYATRSAGNTLGQSAPSIDNWTDDLSTTIGLARKSFDAQGNLVRQEILTNGGVTIGAAGGDVTLPITTVPISITINSQTVERNEWLPANAATIFDWSPPPGTREA